MKPGELFLEGVLRKHYGWGGWRMFDPCIPCVVVLDSLLMEAIDGRVLYIDPLRDFLFYDPY